MRMAPDHHTHSENPISSQRFAKFLQKLMGGSSPQCGSIALLFSSNGEKLTA
jgi:hypothetical protein